MVASEEEARPAEDPGIDISREPQSPCRNVCRLNPQTALCEGCLRTRDEIAGWKEFSAAEKQQVIQRLKLRGRSAGLMITHCSDAAPSS